MNMLSKTRNLWIEAIPWVVIDASRLDLNNQLTEDTLDSQDVAFIQFTSGSTAEPKVGYP